MVVRSGAIVKYVGQWPQSLICAVVGFCDSPSQILAKVIPRLNNENLAVLQSSLPGVSTAFGNSFTVNLTLQNNRGMDFGSERDLVSIVQHAVYEVTGAFPLSDSIPSIQNPNFSTPVITGQPGSPTVADSVGSIFGDVGTSLQNLASNTQLVIIGGAIGLIAAVLLITKGKA